MSSDASNSSPEPDQLAADTIGSVQIVASKITSADLFWSFLQVGLYGFGGIAAIGRHMIVERRKWLNEQDYAALLGLCQILPGGNVINVAAILGDRYCGPAGAFWAVTGLFAMPLLLLVAIAGIYDQ
ncbi:MAG: chromate transporter, partial [Alphaproteobacteria bacterium]|nr:chromate transporter [Alphaproteobacteria bacterium]